VGILEATQVTKQFGGLIAVNSVDLDIPERSISGVIGPNGAGKTTLFNCLTGFYLPERGTMVFDGALLNGRRPDQIAGIGIARTYQNIRLFSGMTALENILVGQHHRLRSGVFRAIVAPPSTRREERAALEEAQEMLEFVGLGGKGDLFARNLPYGDQRRLEIARALAAKPKLLLLDEPAAGMNPQETVELMDLIHLIRDRFELTVLLIEHQMRVVMGICEQITVMDFGEVIARGTAREIQTNPDVIEAYLGKGKAVSTMMAHQPSAGEAQDD
jgi:branched-chain amino acid transport system ATP-binding protein